jgi:phage-related protein
MVRRSPSPRAGEGGRDFKVRPTRQVRRESEQLFQTPRESLWVIAQLKLLRHWPMDARQQQLLGTSLDFSKVHHHGQTFYELRLDDERLHQRNLRMFFWVHESSRTIWIIHGYWKKTRRLDEAVKSVVSRRIKLLEAGLSDGSIR